MNKRITGAVLAASLAAGLCMPAQAVSAAPGAAICMTTAAAMQRVASRVGTGSTPGTQGSTLAFADVERVVRANNTSIKSFDKTLAGVGATDVGESFIEQYANLETQIAGYQKQINDLEKSIKKLQADNEDGQNDALIRTLKAQKSSLEASLASVERSYRDLSDDEDDAEDDLEVTYNSTERQLGNAADQIVMGAETSYISLHTLDNTVDEIDRNIAAIDRSIATVKAQIALGAATQLDLQALQTQRESLTANRQTLITQRQNLKNSLAILCGYGTGETVEVGSLPEVTSSQIAAMDYDKDLATALKNSYSIWEKQDAVRQANDNYEDNKTNTMHAIEAAKIDLEAQKETVTNSFRQLFNSVKDKSALYDSAAASAAQEAKNFKVSEVQYERGAISKNAYQDAQDKLAAAEQEQATAKIELFTAYNTYKWALRGVMS
ncbi:MAG: TolC family protein [Butyricicoccus sp.]